MCEQNPYNLDDIKDIQSDFFYYYISDKLKQTVQNDRILEKLENNNNETSVVNFYNNKNVFITGGSGFMGKVLLEKLLRSCTGIGTIYLLLREKKGDSEEDRLKQMLKNPVCYKYN